LICNLKLHFSYIFFLQETEKSNFEIEVKSLKFDLEMGKKSFQEQIQSLVSKNLNLSRKLESLEKEKTRALEKLAQRKKELKELRAKIKKYQTKEKLFTVLESENRRLKKNSKSYLREDDGTSDPQKSDTEIVASLLCKNSELEKVNAELLSQLQEGLSDRISLRKQISELQNQLSTKMSSEQIMPSSRETGKPGNSSTVRTTLNNSFEVTFNHR
jgi:hypothetical protein